MTWREPSRLAANLTRGTLDLLPSHLLDVVWTSNPEGFSTNPHSPTRVCSSGRVRSEWLAGSGVAA